MKYPKASLHFLTSKEFKPLIEGSPFIDKVLLYDRKNNKGIKGLYALSKSILTENYDLVIDLHGTTRARLLEYFCFFVPFIRLNKRSIKRSLFVLFKWNFLDKTPHLKRLLLDFSPIIPFNGKFSDLQNFISEKAIDSTPYLSSTPWTFKKLKKMEGKMIALSPVASFPSKRWPIESFYSLVELILKDPLFEDSKIAILGGPSDTYLNSLCDLASNPRVLYLQGKLSLEETATYIKNSKICISNDTGLFHIAESFGVPALVLFGPTVLEFGFGPHLNSSVVVEENLDFRPCSKTGEIQCHHEKGKGCLDSITPLKVFNTFKDMWLRANH